MHRRRAPKSPPSSSATSIPTPAQSTGESESARMTVPTSNNKRPSSPLLPTSNTTSPPPAYSSIASNRNTSLLSRERRNMDISRLSRRSQWIVLAVASGACAAFNGVFAKLTTTELTTKFALSLANLLGLGDGEKVVEYIIRGMFFALNLIFNGIMWTLFTKALTAGTSTTQVSIINTSANFITTAVLSFFIFTESLPPLWWLGATLLVAGNVIIGRREEKDTGVMGPVGEGVVERGGEEGEGLLGDAGGEEEIDLDERVDGRLKRGGGRGKGRNSGDDDVLDLGLERVKSEDEDLRR